MKSEWKCRASDLCNRINADCRNHRMLADPWASRAHIMVQGWRNIASQGRLNPKLQTETKVITWTQAAERMKTRIYARRQFRLLDQTTWTFWANHLPQFNLRYIPKRSR